MTIEPVVSIAITVLMGAGVALRKTRRRHVPVMATVIAADVALLLWVETQAHAINTTLEGELPTWLWVHIGLALAVIAGYLFAVVTGIVLWRNGRSPIRSLHRANGWTVVAARIGLLVTTPGLFFPALS